MLPQLTPDILQKKTHSESLKRHTVEYLKTMTKSFAYTRQVLDELRRQIEAELKELGGNRGLDAIMAKLSYPDSDYGRLQLLYVSVYLISSGAEP